MGDTARRSLVLRGDDSVEPATLFAAEQAIDVGARLLRRGRQHVGALIAKGDRDFATAIDVQIERAIKEVLAQACPGVPFLGEEQGGADLDEEMLWVLDPIDGTINFARDSPLCAISLALVHEGRPVLGLVDVPLLGERYIAQHKRGAYLNGGRLQVAEVPALSEAVIGFTDFAVGAQARQENRVHLALVRELAQLSLRIRAHGCAALDLAWLAAGRLNATFMLSNRPWDVSAGVLLAIEAGAEVYDYDGSPYSSRSRYTIASTPNLKAPLGNVLQRTVPRALR